MNKPKAPAIPIYIPSLDGNEREYVNRCLDSTWISSKGEFIEQFESEFARYTGIGHATGVCNGTVALHLALAALGIGPGDEVIVPTLTYIASVNTIVQIGATPVLVDSLENTWQVDPEDIVRKITPRTRAVMVVHLYGHPCDMDPIVALCADRGLYLIEDCAEAFGSRYHGKHVGTFGDAATFSFFGNKTITTGEGGMVACRSEQLHRRCAHLKNQGAASYKQYWHDELGYNYRMTNICAAIGLAQLERADEIIRAKREIAARYREGLKGLPLVVHGEFGDVVHSYWMTSILLDQPNRRDLLSEHLDEVGIETRPVFYPVHTMPMYSGLSQVHPVAKSIASRGINLPSWPKLREEQVAQVCEEITRFLAE